MEGWMLALLMKGAAGIGLAFGYWLVVYKGAALIGRFIPPGRVKDFLFRERGRQGAGPGTDLR